MKDIFRIYFDTETYTDFKAIVKPYIIFWTTDTDTKKLSYSFEPHTEFFEMLEFYSSQKNKRVELWGHNINYDLKVIYPLYLSTFPHNSKRIWKVNDKGKFLFFKYRGKGVNKINIVAKDTWRWKGLSLGSWIESLNVDFKKGSIDYDKNGYVELRGDKFYYLRSDGTEASAVLKDEIEYGKSDVLSLPLIVRRIQEEKETTLKLFKLDKEKEESCQTAPSFARYILNRLMGGNNKKDLFMDKYRPVVSLEEARIMEYSCMGGFTFFNKDVLEVDSIKPIIKKYDINSHYPNIMYRGIPYGEFTKEDVHTIPVYECQIYGDIEYIEELKMLSTMFCTSAQKRGKRFYAFPLWLDLFKKFTKCKIVIHDTKHIRFGKQDELTESIEQLYEVKSTTKDPMEKTVCKLKLNSMFGKFMQKDYLTDNFFDLGVMDFVQEERDDVPRRSRLTGIYIVQMAKAILLHTIYNEIKNGNVILYGDTDSLIMLENKPPLFSIGSRLGQWKFEGEYHVYRNVGKTKKYLLWNYDKGIEYQQLVMSGIDNRVKEILVDENREISFWKTVFNKDNNVIFVNGRVVKKKNELGQDVLTAAEVEFNRGVDVSHRLDITKSPMLSELLNGE